MNCIGLGVALLGMLVAPALAQTNDWPIWRGPGRTAMVDPKGLAKEWPEAGPKQVWKVKVGIGYASPSVHDGKLYAFYLEGSKDVLECLEAATGKSLWKQSYDGGYAASYKGTRSSPVIEGDRIYTYGGSSQLVAWNLADGKILWNINVLQDTGGKNKMWGTASNPTIDGDVIYVQGGEGGNAVVCVDKKTGKYVWKSEAKDGGYAPVVPMTVDGKKQLLCFGHDTMVSMDAATGKTLWKNDETWEIEWHINAAMPVIQGNRVFLSVAYKNGHCGMYEVSAAGAKQIWGGKQATTRFQPAILDNGYMYVNSEGTLKCIKWEDGTIAWSATSERTLLGMGGSLLRFGDRLICLSERGKLTLLQATPEGFKKISEVKDAATGKDVWATPAVYQGKLFIKGQEEIVCYDIGG